MPYAKFSNEPFNCDSVGKKCMQRRQGKNGARPLVKRTANAPDSRRGEGKRKIAPVRTQIPPSSTLQDNKGPSARAVQAGDVAKPAPAMRSLRKAHLSSAPATPSRSTDKSTGDEFLPKMNSSGSEDDGWTVVSKGNRSKGNGNKNKNKGNIGNKKRAEDRVDCTPAAHEPCMTPKSTKNIKKNINISKSACDSKQEPQPLSTAASSLEEMEARIFGIPLELWHMNWDDQEQNEAPTEKPVAVTEPASQPMKQGPLPTAASSLDEMEARIFGIPVELWHVKWEDKEPKEIHARDEIAGKRIKQSQQKQQTQCSLAKLLQDAQVRFDQKQTSAVDAESEPEETLDDQEDQYRDEGVQYSSDFSGKNPFLLLEVDC